MTSHTQSRKDAVETRNPQRTYGTFTDVEGLHEEGLAEDEGDALPGAEVCAPVPPEGSLDHNDRSLLVRLEKVEEDIAVSRALAMAEELARVVVEADVHSAGMQIDADVVPLALRLVSHRDILSRSVDLPSSNLPRRQGGRGPQISSHARRRSITLGTHGISP